jgi:hypothetical protein
MIRRRRTIAALTLAAAALAGGTTAALAAVAPVPAAAPNGEAGYNATAPGGFTDDQAVITPTQYASTIKAGDQGVQLCAAGANLAAQAGLASSNTATTFAVGSAVGVLQAGVCPAGGVLPNPVTFPGLAAVPFGHHVWVDARLMTRNVTRRALVCTPAVPGVTPPPGSFTVGGLTCVRQRITLPRSRVVFQAQDLDAPAAGAPAGDQPGLQVRIARRLPPGTVLNSAGTGISTNATALVGCAGNGFPMVLAGPAAYTTAACQPVTTATYATATPAGGAATPLSGLAVSEVVSPDAAGALVAPNNTLTGTSTGPAGPAAAGASQAGSAFTVFTGSAPTG